MDKLIYLYYVLLIVLLFWGAKFIGRKNWNDGFLSLSQTKALQGFCVICIMMHHIGQRTCAPWLKQKYIVHGLDFFVPIGYLFVGVFLFCSGYGLYKSFKLKQDYLKGFLSHRLLPLLVASFITSIIYIVVRNLMGDYIGLPQFIFRIGGPNQYNPYGWYVTAIFIFYLGFYLAFRFCKKEKNAVIVTCLVVVLYMLHCNFWMFGGWWYNSVPLFCVGFIFARHEEAIILKIKNHYLIYWVSSFIAMLGFYIIGTYLDKTLNGIVDLFQYSVGNWIYILTQSLSCTFFVLFLFLSGMKVKIGNKALNFMGKITLEFYLMHGLIVQLFSYRFFNDYMKPIYYAKNVALHVLIVLIISVPVAYVLHKAVNLVSEILIEKKAFVFVILKDIKKFLIVTCVIFAGLTLLLTFTSHYKSREGKKAVEKYENEYIRYADVDGKKMAAYITGEGNHTIVLLCGVYDPCPTITLKPFAEALAKKNKVIILDYLGSGLSDETNKKRTSENLVYEIHTALQSLGEKGPFIFMPHEMSGIYTQLYTYTYPDEVEAVVGLDTCVPQQVNELIRTQRCKIGEYKKMMKKQAEQRYLFQRILSLSGYVRIQWRKYEPILNFKHNKEDFDVLQQIFVDRFNNKTITEQLVYDYDNFSQVGNRKYAKDLPVYLILAEQSCDVNGQWYYDMDFKKMHEDLLSNTDIQSISIMAGNTYFIYIKPDTIAKEVQKFIDKL